MRETRFQTCARLINSGMTREQVMAEMGVTRENLVVLMGRARSKGLLPPIVFKQTNSIDHELKCRDRNKGRVGDMLGALTPEVATWLIGQIPEGMTMMEFVGSIVVDAYLDEVDA